jgi:hypothetical protein
MKRLAFGVLAFVAALTATTGWGAPGRTKMESPAAGDTRDRRPEFRWTVATDATQYLLSITRNGAPYLEKWTRKTGWEPRFDFPEGVFEARVIGYDGAEYGQWSAKVKFRRVFTPSISVLNGLSGDGAAITLEAGPGIAIAPVASNRTIVISSTGITATQIVALSVTTEKIDTHAVTYDKLADDAVYGNKIADGGVSSNKLAPGSVHTEHLAEESVVAGKLADASVYTDNLIDGLVTTPKINDGAVTSNKLAAGNVKFHHIESGGAVNGQPMIFSSGKWGPGTLYAGYAEGSISAPPSALEAGAIALGSGNNCAASDSIVLGGSFNSILEDSSASVIAGGGNNTISSSSIFSTIIGGRLNQITKQYCMASGFRAKATNEGSFVWADSTGGGVGSWGTNTVVFMASGGVRFQSSTPGMANHRVEWKPGDGGWSYSSDRNLKEGIEPVDAREVLDRVDTVPVARWRFKGSERVHIGVMAQDFAAAFPLPGQEATLLDSADLHGVSLAAIQALHAQLKAEQARNAALEARLEALEKRLGK